MRSFSFVLIVVILALLIFSFASPTFACKPVIQDVAVSKIGDSYFLDITIYHTPEDESHYVDTIRVNVAYVNTTDLQIGPQALSADNTFTISYDLGPLPDDPIAVGVWVRCTHGDWSDPWSDYVPEFSLPIMLIGFVLVASLAAFAFRRAKLASDR
jgi:hypothetical protein